MWFLVGLDSQKGFLFNAMATNCSGVGGLRLSLMPFGPIRCCYQCGEGKIASLYLISLLFGVYHFVELGNNFISLL